jgi:hypothetical protein
MGIVVGEEFRQEEEWESYRWLISKFVFFDLRIYPKDQPFPSILSRRKSPQRQRSRNCLFIEEFENEDSLAFGEPSDASLEYDRWSPVSNLHLNFLPTIWDSIFIHRFSQNLVNRLTKHCHASHEYLVMLHIFRPTTTRTDWSHGNILWYFR